MEFIDRLLNKITMYRLMLYYLAVLYVAALLLSLFRLISFNPLNLILPTAFITVVCILTNYLFSKLLKISTNYESQFITAFILVLIIGPLSLTSNILFLVLASFFAIASKFLLVYKKQHFFNPAAFGVTATALILNQGSSWWAGDKFMLPLIIAGGLLVSRKINRGHLVVSFLLSLSVFLFIIGGFDFTRIYNYILNPATMFFVFIMLTEPITSPASKKYRIYFGIMTALFIVLYQTFLGVFYTLELALLTANLIGRLISFSTKWELMLKEKREIGLGLWEYLFTPNHKLNFIAGQYLEWTLPHQNMDTRGMRRYFTIASAPTEKEIKLAVKIPENPSSYKKALNQMSIGDKLTVTNLEGEFILPKDNSLELVFIAGGIGITPFVSIIKEVMEKKLSYKITLFYLAHDPKEFAYDEVFSDAKQKIGFKIIKVIGENSPKGWTGETGRLTPDILAKYVPDLKSALYYISGPQLMVSGYKKMLLQNGVGRRNIKSDYFPGYEVNDR